MRDMGEKYMENTCSNIILSTKIPTIIGLGLNPVLRRKSAVAHIVSNGTISFNFKLNITTK